MDQSISKGLLGVMAEGVKDKFFTLCGGALVIAIFYVYNRDVIDSFIIKEGHAYFTYISTIMMLLSATFIVDLIQRFLNYGKGQLDKRYWKYGVLKKLLHRLTAKELEFVRDQIMLKNVGERGNFPFKITNKLEVDNLIKAGKVNNFSTTTSKEGKFFTFRVENVLPSEDYGKGFEFIEKEYQKRKRQEEKSKAKKK